MLMYFFYVVMYALFVLSVHVYYVNGNAKIQMGYLCALIKKTIVFVLKHIALLVASLVVARNW